MKNSSEKNGFTLIELLVVIAIIASLVGIMVPALGAVKRQMRNLRQKAHFHSMEIALELFSKDYDGYPDSETMPFSGSFPLVCGAQHLTEAIAGRDLRGFEPSSQWYGPTQDPLEKLYDWTDPVSMNRRKPLYMELRDTDVFIAENIYSVNPWLASSGSAGGGEYYAPFFSDVFKIKRIETVAQATPWNEDRGRVWAGSPVLYYKADTSSKLFDPRETGYPPSPTAEQLDSRKWIYNFDDNLAIISLGTVADPLIKHEYDPTETQSSGKNGRGWFYESIRNPETSGPYNANTFILISAGWDGIYGTKDDITNFNY